VNKLLLPLFFLSALHLNAQDIKGSFNSAFKKFTLDKSFKHATIGLLVVNNSSGKIVTSLNAETGMAPASCQKIITASSSYELLGHKYSYKTTLGYTGKIEYGVLKGDIIISGSGDPTLGSWRYNATKEDSILAEFRRAIYREGINEINGHVHTNQSIWQGEIVPGGWIWEDVGNYYGAGAEAINWRENQYDLFLKSGKNIGDPVQYVYTNPPFVEDLDLKVLATSAPKGSGDQTVIYIPLFGKKGYVRGTIPVDENNFTVSGSMPHPARQLALSLESSFKKVPADSLLSVDTKYEADLHAIHTFYTHQSPVLDSIIFWFLKKSINLYGEALIKTIAFEQTKHGETDSGVSIIKNFWSKKGIEPSAMNIIDGSGLSPANRMTPSTLVSILQYAKKQAWYSSFYSALPEINGIKMKSGSIGGVVSYAGYITSKTGINYTFAFIINNFDNDANEVRKKMWKLLDLLK
jgi:D-alanyl-D-alanine carboxypeptidase/D-alanyl-D-alanine-endopeptidase (penicillin-binding protein 4)